MALLRPYLGAETRTGTAYPNCYVRISHIQVDALNRLKMQVDWWASRAWAKSGQKVPWKTEAIVMENFDQAGGNPKMQGYAYLKASVPELTSATDAQP